MPSTVRPVGSQVPSPGSGVSTNGCMATGGVVLGSSVSLTDPTSSARSVGIRPTAADVGAAEVGSPPSGVPPLGGAFFVYHQRSMELTIGPKPCSRIHSTVRAPMESVPGARSVST